MKSLWLALLVAPLAFAAPEYQWPQANVPPDARLQSPGEKMLVNGMPVKILRFDTARDLNGLARDFSAGIKGQVVRREPTPADPRTTLAGRVGDFWVTLQVASLPGGRSQATWSAAPQFIAGAKLPVAKPPGFPANAELLQQVDSFDDGKNSRLAIGLDPSAVDTVAARVQEDLRGLGYIKQDFPPRNWTDDGQFSAVFVNGREEIVVSLRPERTGTSVVINRISALERLQ